MESTTDRKQIRNAEKLAKLAEQNRREVLAQIMSSIPGREWVWNQLQRAHIFSTSFSFDAITMAFSEGERNQGLVLLNDIMIACPEEFILAMREANGRRTESELRAAAANGRSGEPAGSEESGWESEGQLDAADGEEARH